MPPQGAGWHCADRPHRQGQVGQCAIDVLRGGHKVCFVSKAYGNAIPWLERAANAGHMRAPLVLGILYEQGSGVKEDPATAAKWYQKGIDNGNAAAARRLANLYHLGTGVPH